MAAGKRAFIQVRYKRLETRSGFADTVPESLSKADQVPYFAVRSTRICTMFTGAVGKIRMMMEML